MRRHTKAGITIYKKALRQKRKQKNPCIARAFVLVPVVGLEPNTESEYFIVINHFFTYVLKIVLHKLFGWKNIAKIIVHHILDRGFFSCHNVTVYAVNHGLVFVADVVGNVLFRNIKRNHD